jgi:hypothetical protein
MVCKIRRKLRWGKGLSQSASPWFEWDIPLWRGADSTVSARFVIGVKPVGGDADNRQSPSHRADTLTRQIMIRSLRRHFPNGSAHCGAIIVALTFAVLSNEAAGQAPAATAPSQPLEEIFRGESVYAQGKGEVQLTLVPSGYRFGGVRESNLEFELEYGLTNSWQLQLEWETYSWRTGALEPRVAGTGGASIGTKYTWMGRNPSSLHVAAGLMAELPGGSISNGMGSEWAFEPFVVVAKDFGGPVPMQLFTDASLSMALEAEELGNGHESRTALRWNGGVFVPVAPFVFTAEATLDQPMEREAAAGLREFSITPGMKWTVAEMEFGIGFPIDIRRASGKRTNLILQLVYEFGGAHE